MKTDEFDRFTLNLNNAVEQDNFEVVFAEFSEQQICDFSERIINDSKDFGDLITPLLHAFNFSFFTFEDKKVIAKILLNALLIKHDPWIYDSAQNTILSYAQSFDSSDAKRLHNLFIQRYSDEMEEGDLYIAMRALEGIIMFPIFRGDNKLLIKGLGIVLTDFPEIPDDPHAAAELPVKALKLLGRCYDQQPNEEIKDLISSMIDCKNYAVRNESRFNLGIIKLYDAFRSNDETGFWASLVDAKRLFQESSLFEEGRTDAKLFATITDFYVAISQTALLDKISTLVQEAKDIFIHRTFSFTNIDEDTLENIEFGLIKLISAFEKFIENLSSIHQQPNIGLPIKELANIYSAVRTWEGMQGLVGVASRSGHTWIVLPNIHGKFIQVQEISAKLSTMLRDDYWCSCASESEVNFCEFVLHEISSMQSKKAQATTRLDTYRVAAEKDDPELAYKILEMQEKNVDYENMLIEIMQYCAQRNQMSGFLFTDDSATDREIYNTLFSDLMEKLKWDLGKPKLKYLSETLRLITRYFYMMYHLTNEEAKPNSVKFLYAKDSNGLGQVACEGDLESHFYLQISLIGQLLLGWQGYIERQTISGIPGRSDILFKFPGNIIFVVEVKCEDTNIKRDNIRTKFVAQAQTYAAGTHQVTFMFVLDTTKKEKGIPLKNIRDYCFIERIENDSSYPKHPDYVVVFIFPANRFLPSKHTSY